MESDYQLLDSGKGRKLERFGPLTLARPCPQALWPPSLPDEHWARADASFQRDKRIGWGDSPRGPERWTVRIADLSFELRRTPSGQVGVFPEQAQNWTRITDACRAIATKTRRPPRVLNLFAYTGGSTLAAARAGAEVCHVDASKSMTQWGRRNAELNGLEGRPIRWIVDDVPKFVGREIRRGREYDLIILDPPSYGHGAGGESFTIAEQLPPLLARLHRVSPASLQGMLLTCHTAELTPLSLRHLLARELEAPPESITCGGMSLEGPKAAVSIPSGSFCWWTRDLGR